MLTVALAAVAAAGVRSFMTLRVQSRVYQSRARVHDLYSRFADIRSGLSWYSVNEKEAAKKLSVWHAGRRDIYKAAAARPWRIVPPEAEPKTIEGEPKRRGSVRRRRDSKPPPATQRR